jgi:hypothetical protein
MPIGLQQALAITLFASHAVGCASSGADMSEEATPGAPRPSPSGRYVLMVIETADEAGHPMKTFQIKHPSGQELYAAAERWSTRHRLHFVWDREDRVWVYSSDVGTNIWERSDTGWTRTEYAARPGVEPPDFLKRYLRPRAR